jgi:hypothetical protein
MELSDIKEFGKPFYIIVDRYKSSITNGTHYATREAAREVSLSMATKNPETEFFVCMVESSYKNHQD